MDTPQDGDKDYSSLLVSVNKRSVNNPCVLLPQLKVHEVAIHSCDKRSKSDMSSRRT